MLSPRRVAGKMPSTYKSDWATAGIFDLQIRLGNVHTAENQNETTSNFIEELHVARSYTVAFCACQQLRGICMVAFCALFTFPIGTPMAGGSGSRQRRVYDQKHHHSHFFLRNICELYNGLACWRRCPFFYKVRFEQLIIGCRRCPLLKIIAIVIFPENNMMRKLQPSPTLYVNTSTIIMDRTESDLSSGIVWKLTSS